MRTALAGLAGAMVAVGLVMAVVGMQRVPVDPAPRRATRWRPRTPRTRPDGPTWRRWRWPVVVLAGLTAWAVTGWPAAAVIVAAIVVGLPVLLGTAKVAARAIDRVEGIEEWTRRLSDLLVTGIGLEQAITNSVRSCPEIIRPEVSALATRLGSRWPTEAALRAFAADLDDAAGDLVSCALILSARRRGPGLSRVLSSVADSVAQDVDVRRKIEAERAKPRATARAVTLITLAVVAVGAFNGTYLAPYATPLGQVVLVLITGAFVACLAWMRALTLTPDEPRLLAAPEVSDAVRADPLRGVRGR